MVPIEVRYIHEMPLGDTRIMANIMFEGKCWPMKKGCFPADHPCVQNADGLAKFRALGYWAGPFPEGDGITLDVKGRSRDEVIADIQQCFGWTVRKPNPPKRPNPWAMIGRGS